jgi:hypothetical protein
MPFDYLRSYVNKEYSASFPKKTLAMRLDEVRYRARLMRALGYEQKETLARILGNVEWEFEMIPSSSFTKELKKVVAMVYDRREPFGNVA